MANTNRDPNRHYRTNATDYTAADRADGESVSRTLVETVAALDGVEPTELPVLAEFVDPDALNDLFGRRFDGTRRAAEGRVEFEYAGYRVTVDTDGAVTVSSVTEDE